MELTVTSRHVTVSDRFRRVCEEKLAKIEQFAPRTQRVEVFVSEETSRGAPKGSERVEITCASASGQVLRAEAHAEDPYSALDLALDKLSERLRRANDKKVGRRRSHKGLEDVTSGLHVAELNHVGESSASENSADEGAERDLDERLGVSGESPVHVREKTHSSPAMTLDQALYAMELVGHDFYLFHDKDSDSPSVVYRRRGWDYGVIHLDVTEEQAEAV